MKEVQQNRIDKYIFCQKEAFSKQECQTLIDRFNINKERVEGPINEVTTRTKKYFYTRIILYPLNEFWAKHLSESLEKYTTEHPFLGKGSVGNWTIDKQAYLQKYKPNQCYDVEHCEHGPKFLEPYRIFAWMIYLNTINKGGGTCWPQQEFSSKASVGDLYMWPAAWTHSHKGVVAPEEEKYIITGWGSLIPDHKKEYLSIRRGSLIPREKNK